MENESKPPKPYTKYRSARFKPSHPLKNGESPEPKFGGSDGGFPGAPPVKPKRRRRWGRIILIAVLALIGLFLLAAGFFYWRLNQAVDASNAKVPADARAALKPATGGPVNILFMGSDKRPGENARADTLLILRVDDAGKTISQLSIPRDTLVDVPGYGQGKINSAYAYGGPALEMETIEKLTGIPINHYVELQFSGFPAIVNDLGGVDINVPYTIDSKYPNGYQWTHVHFDPGPQHMDGDRALIYVRVRYSDDDFHRMARQQQFMEALQQKMTSPMNIVKMPLIAPDIIGNMITDMSTNDLLRLGWDKFRTPASQNHKYVLAGVPRNIDGLSYVVLDENANQKQISDFLSPSGSG